MNRDPIKKASMNERQEAFLSVADVFENCPEAWTKNYQARLLDGSGVFYDHPQAVCWCLWGGLMAAGRMYYQDGPLLDDLARQMGYGNSVSANNHGGREVAIKLLRMAAGEL